MFGQEFRIFKAYPHFQTAIRRNKEAGNLETKKIVTRFGKSLAIHVNEEGLNLTEFMPTSVCLFVMKQWLKNPFRPIFIWTESFQANTYQAFQNTMKECYPAYNRHTPSKIKSVIDLLGIEYYGAAYNPITGTVKSNKYQAHLNDNTLNKQDQHLKFYMKANGKQMEGEGLITVIPVSKRNLLHCALKTLRKNMGL